MNNFVKTLAFFCLFIACLSAQAFGQISGAGNVGCSGAVVTGTAVTSGTANNTVLFTGSNAPVWGYSVQLTQTSTVSGGAISFQYSNDGGSTYVNVPVAQVLNNSTFAQLTNPYTLVASTNQSFLIIMGGASNFQVKLTTALTGSATVTPFVTAVCTAPPALGLDSSGNLKVNISAQALSKILATVDPVTIGAALPAGTNLIGESPNTTTATTTNAASACAIVSAVSNNATSCKGSSGNFYGVWLVNTTATIYYLRLYNTSSAPTCSSATGFIQSIPIPASTSGAGVVINPGIPVGYGTGIGYCLTGGSSSTDNTSAATGVFGQVLYK